jgi:simple sugar transport system ATP-binding protein
VLDYSIADNLVLGLQHRFSQGARLDRRAVDENARRLVREFDIRPADPALPRARSRAATSRRSSSRAR